MFSWFKKRKEAKREAKMHHVYMSVEPVLLPEVRSDYEYEKFFHNYRGKTEDYAGFKREMEYRGHNVITSKVRLDCETKGGPRKLDGVYVDQSLSPVEKSEVV